MSKVETGHNPAEDSSLPSEVIEENGILARVINTAQNLPKRRKHEDYRAALNTLRDSLTVERLPEDRASIIEQMERIGHLATQRARYAEAELDLLSPYFGRMKLVDENGQVRDILLGKQTFIYQGVCLVDWRNAPISRIFYQSEVGDEYELTIDGRDITGEMVLRRTLTIDNSQLQRVSTPDKTYVRQGKSWCDITAEKPTLRGGAGASALPDRTQPVSLMQSNSFQISRKDKHLPEIASLLDPEQFELITSPSQGLIAISGSAGSGKTTVALHRVAYLAFQDPRRFNPLNTIVIVFSPALARYISQVLPALGVNNVKVLTYDRWVRRLRIAHFPKLVRRWSSDTPAVVSKFKLSAALLPMLTEGGENFSDLSPAQLFDELFTNQSWLKNGIEKHAPGSFSSNELERIHRWCTRQHYARVDTENHQKEHACYDVEDDTILLRLYQITRGPLLDKQKHPLAYSHLVVDEVQDLSPVELMVLMETIGKNMPITLAGDTAQQISENTDFQNWRQVLSLLGHEHIEVSPLQISYRATEQVMQLAHDILGPLAPESPPLATKSGAPVSYFNFTQAGQCLAFLTDVLRELGDVEPNANVGILTRSLNHAEEIYRGLMRADLPRIHLVKDYDFSFSPGIEITTVKQVKGLEFDYVLIVDCNAGTYPDNDISRRLLHVAVTRTAYQCWLLSVGRPSPLIPDYLLKEENNTR